MGDSMDDNGGDEASTQIHDENCRMQYNPVNYEFYELTTPNQNQMGTHTDAQLTECRTDLKPTVMYDHFFRAAIASALPPSKFQIDDSVNLNAKYNARKDYKRLAREDERDDLSKATKPDKLSEMYDAIDAVSIAAPKDNRLERIDEAPQLPPPKPRPEPLPLPKNQIKIELKPKKESQTIPEVVIEDEKSSKTNLHLVPSEKRINRFTVSSTNISATPTNEPPKIQNPRVKMLKIDSNAMKPRTTSFNDAANEQELEYLNRMRQKLSSNAIAEKKFSIVSLFNNPKQIFGTTSNSEASMHNLNNISQIMNSCLIMQDAHTSNAYDATNALSKVVKFTVEDSKDEQTVEEINKNLAAQGLPEIQTFISTQKEVLKKKKTREHERDKLSGMMLNLLVVGLIMALAFFLSFRVFRAFVQSKNVQLSTQKAFATTPTSVPYLHEFECFSLHGEQHGDTYAFKGIPYTNETPARWKKSAVKQCGANETVRVNSRVYNSRCIQNFEHSEKSKGSEDCLFVNVWTASLNSAAKLPVVVYIHGGKFQYGSGEIDDKYELEDLVGSGIVFVTFNYRLNVFGYLYTGEKANLGFSDQIVALEWVQRYVHHFGGDRDRVTLVGQEAGAISALLIALTVRRNHLFKNVWISHLPSQMLEFELRNSNVETEALVTSVMRNFNCSSFECLNAVNASELIRAFRSISSVAKYDLLSHFIYDGDFINSDIKRIFSDMKNEEKDQFNDGDFLNETTIVVGTNLTSAYSAVVCNNFRLLKYLSKEAGATLYHYNLEFIDTKNFPFVNLFNSFAVDLKAMIDHPKNFEKYGTAGVKFQHSLREHFLSLLNFNRLSGVPHWTHDSEDALMNRYVTLEYNPNINQTNEFFKTFCNKVEK